MSSRFPEDVIRRTLRCGVGLLLASEDGLLIPELVKAIREFLKDPKPSQTDIHYIVDLCLERGHLELNFDNTLRLTESGKAYIQA